MATATTTFSVIEQYFWDIEAPHMTNQTTESLLQSRDIFMKTAVTTPALVQHIENFYGVTVW